MNPRFQFSRVPSGSKDHVTNASFEVYDIAYLRELDIFRLLSCGTHVDELLLLKVTKSEQLN